MDPQRNGSAAAAARAYTDSLLGPFSGAPADSECSITVPLHVTSNTVDSDVSVSRRCPFCLVWLLRAC